LITLLMALSIAGIGAVRGAADAVRQALHVDPRVWLAADLYVDTRDPITEQQAAALDALKPRGIEWTLVTTALTMAESDQSPDPGLVAVKAVNPALYPFYGAIGLSPRQPLRTALDAERIVVSQDLMDRFQIRVGGLLRVAGRPFTVAGVIESEPDRLSGELGLGMRCILSREAYDRTGIERSGNSVKRRILVRLAPGADLAAARRRLRALFPEANIRDYTTAHGRASGIAETAISFLGVTALLALALGLIGIGLAVRQHADHSMPSLAIMRILGARSAQLGAVFFLQIACMMAVAVAIGVPLGMAVRAPAIRMAEKYVTIPRAIGWDWAAVVESATAVLLVTMPVLAQPAAAIWRLRPAIVLRRDAGELTPHRGTHAGFLLLACVPAFAGLTLLTGAMLHSPKSAAMLCAALLLCAGIAWMLAAWTVRLLRRAVAALDDWPALRHGIANLDRPGNHTRVLIVALAIALAVMIATFDGSAAVLRAAFNVLPYDRNSLYIAGFQPSRSDVLAFLRNQPGVGGVRVVTEARLELEQVKVAPGGGWQPPRVTLMRPKPVDNPRVALLPMRSGGACRPGYVLDIGGDGDGCISVADSGRPEAGVGIRSDLLGATGGADALTAAQWNETYMRVTGMARGRLRYPSVDPDQLMTVDYYLAHWGPGGGSYLIACGPRGSGLILAPDTALRMGARVGSRLQFVDRDRVIDMSVSAIRAFPPADRLWSGLQLDCSTLNPASLFRYAAARVRPDRMAAVEQAVREEYPALAVITPQDIAETAGELSGDAMMLVRVVAWYAIAAGFAIMIAAIAASRTARVSEMAILSALGGRRSTVLAIYTIEFAALGLVSGAIAALLACGLGSVVLDVVFQRMQLAGDWGSTAAAVFLAALLAVVAGWLPSYGLLRKKPMEVLRGE
jgi:predicted lysophospholipase L1 biosynthesis ABC-type transport system permease subunit